jgi:isocitrate/isopropylmalate dehydrogenase
MRSHNIAVIPGDGTGPEVVAEGLKVLKAVAAPAGFTLYPLRPGRRTLPAHRRNPAGVGH